MIVINHRGLNNTKLLTPITYHGGSSFDTKAALAYIQKKYPGQLLYGISFSLGSNILGRYLGEEGENSVLSGAVCVCCPFNSFEASINSEKIYFGLVSRYLAWNSKNKLLMHDYILPHLKDVHGIEHETIKNCKKFREFDDKITARMFGYTGVLDYYNKCCTVPVLKNFKTKTLFISSQDDPFFGPDVIPYDEFKKNDNIFLMATSGGGHVGFYDSIFSKEQWHNKPALKFLDYLNTLDRYFVKA